MLQRKEEGNRGRCNNGADQGQTGTFSSHEYQLDVGNQAGGATSKL